MDEVSHTGGFSSGNQAFCPNHGQLLEEEIADSVSAMCNDTIAPGLKTLLWLPLSTDQVVQRANQLPSDLGYSGLALQSELLSDYSSPLLATCFLEPVDSHTQEYVLLYHMYIQLWQ